MALLHTVVKPFVTSDFCRRKENPLLLKTALIELLEGGDYCLDSSGSSIDRPPLDSFRFSIFQTLLCNLL